MSNSGPSGFKSVGYVDRAHGLHGEVKVVWELPDPSVIDGQENLLVFLKNNRGDLYPLRALSFRKENKRTSPSFFVRFDKITNRSQAEAIQHRHLFIDAHLYNGWSHNASEESNNYDGFTALDEHGDLIGTIFPAEMPSVQPLVKVATNDGSLLIPLVKPYLVEINTTNQTITFSNVNNLTGL
tara:strand:- start:1669 stop:2217 length:549 start_codon:yes stop_codon:yes gene_type:complete